MGTADSNLQIFALFKHLESYTVPQVAENGHTISIIFWH